MRELCGQTPQSAEYLQGTAMNRTLRDLLVISAIAGACFLLNLGGPHLWDRDEPRNAGCAAEMLARNDWVVPTFNAELREHKPALTYWFMMLSYLTFGVTEFAARLPSATFGIGTTFLTYFIGRRLFGSSAGLWSAIAISTTMMFGVASRAATPDAPLIFFSTLAIAVYIWETTTADSARIGHTPFVALFPQTWGTAAAMYAVMGIAILAKGPIGLVLPTAVIGMFLLIMGLPTAETSADGYLQKLGRLLSPFEPRHFLMTCWTMRPLTAIGCALCVALPWYVLVHLQTDGEWTYGFFVKHNVGRAMNSMDGHRGNLLFYPAALIAGFFPWSIFWIPSLLDGIRQLKTDSKAKAGYLFAFCWVGVYLILFSIAKTKLPSYITPCYPGLALAIGAFVDRWSNGEVLLPKIWPRISFGSLIAVGIGVVIALPIVANIYVPEEMLLGLLGLIPLIGGIAALVAYERQQFRRAVYATTATAVLMSPAIFAYAADQIDEHREIERFVNLLYQGQKVDDVDVISFSSSEASWVFYAKQPIEHFTEPSLAAEELMRPSPTGRPRVLVTTGARMKRIQPYLNEDALTIEQMPYFMEDTDIMVLRPKPSIIQVSAESPKTVQ